MASKEKRNKLNHAHVPSLTKLANEVEFNSNLSISKLHNDFAKKEREENAVESNGYKEVTCGLNKFQQHGLALHTLSRRNSRSTSYNQAKERLEKILGGRCLQRGMR